MIAGHGCDDVVGLLLVEFGRGSEVMWQRSRILQAAAVTPLVHGRTVRKTKYDDQKPAWRD